MDMPKLLDGRLKIRHLLLVDALNRRGTVIGAAAELHISQPVATRSLHDIERILGVALFERDPRGVTPTVFGTAFATHSRGIIAQLTETGRHLVELANADRGTVVVGQSSGRFEHVTTRCDRAPESTPPTSDGRRAGGNSGTTRHGSRSRSD